MSNFNNFQVSVGGKILEGFSNNKLTIDRFPVESLHYEKISGNRVKFLTEDNECYIVDITPEVQEELDKLVPSSVSPFAVYAKRNN